MPRAILFSVKNLLQTICKELFKASRADSEERPFFKKFTFIILQKCQSIYCRLLRKALYNFSWWSCCKRQYSLPVFDLLSFPAYYTKERMNGTSRHTIDWVKPPVNGMRSWSLWASKAIHSATLRSWHTTYFQFGIKLWCTANRSSKTTIVAHGFTGRKNLNGKIPGDCTVAPTRRKRMRGNPTGEPNS